MEFVHAHQILKILGEHGADISASELKEKIAAQFGEGVTFGACSGGGMSFDDLMEFFVQRGKISFDGETISMSAGCGCGH